MADEKNTVPKPEAVTTKDTTAAPKEAAEAKAEAKEKAAVRVKPSHSHEIAKGKSITCKRGILADGDPVNADDLEGGEKTFADLVKRKIIVKAE